MYFNSIFVNYSYFASLFTLCKVLATHTPVSSRLDNLLIIYVGKQGITRVDFVPVYTRGQVWQRGYWAIQRCD